MKAKWPPEDRGQLMPRSPGHWQHSSHIVSWSASTRLTPSQGSPWYRWQKTRHPRPGWLAWDGPAARSSPGSTRSWGSCGHRPSGLSATPRCPFRFGRRGAPARSGAGPALSPRSPGSTFPWTPPPGCHSNRDARQGP